MMSGAQAPCQCRHGHRTLHESNHLGPTTAIFAHALRMLGFVPLLLVTTQAHAQTSVRAWPASGQVFVVWRTETSAPLTYDVYRSTTPVTAITQATLAGCVFEPEWEGLRLKLVSPSATWRIPAAGGGTYQLAANDADRHMLDRYVRRNGCPGDIDANGSVNGADLSALLAAWGPCSSGCAADLNSDSAVNGVDLASLLAAWGACP